ncbi:hypothetical protein I203_102908 [Kwoniella mangroviensis CBS 8507]|uniref:uncharacterized protein n=1 Tax=Kwoniella mangroviensis CBS 8507 TaxID=1296122 RepID=UPI00080CDA7B|nr:uncharacterized protein I203_03882 [Kwoniella mangroviensis CBS 8507]OCF67195.1 hypothetical protein I203_03882 [Kwoniella mangroviensis CBS 8507]
MPYAEPTHSPMTSPGQESPFHFHRKSHHTPPKHIEDIDYGVGSSSGPMPGIPRRNSSHSGSSTPRRGMFDTISKATHAIGSQTFPISRPMEGLPRRSPSSSGPSSHPVSGLPPAESSSLGLKLHPSPVKSPLLHRAVRDSMTSNSTADSSLPSTPSSPHVTLPVHIHDPAKNGESSVPFPAFDPEFKPPPRSSASRGLLSPSSRPTLASMRRSSAGHVRGGQNSTGSLQITFPPPVSHSDDSSPIIGGSSTMLRPINMIRKKSGEIVKPSLKQRSMSTPDLTRQAHDSPTDEHDSPRGFGEERSKSVRFADASEGDAKALESVVLFLREQKVTAVGKAADPENAANTETETENDTDTDFVQFRTRRNAAAKAADENQIIMEGAGRIPRKRTDFSPDARGSLVGENVLLERIELQSGLGPLCMRGTVVVRNVAFQKWVAVRFTLDHWQTVSEVSGTHVCHIPAATSGDEGWDRFSFSIKLDDYKRKLDERQLILCVHYSVEGQDWWDSNDGMNYNFTFKKPAPRRNTRSSLPPALGANYTTDEQPSGLPGLRKSNAPPPSANINKVFGAPSSGPASWVFPKLSQRMNGQVQPPSRPDSPMQTPPPNSFKPPAPPSTHAHLTLAKYCAPSPPLSPTKDASPTMPQIVSPESYDPVDLQRRTSMNVINGNYATLVAPDMGHERRSSWNGQNNSWDSFSQAMENSASPSKSSSGDATPTAHRSPKVPEDEQESTPEHRPLTLKRSTGDLRKLMHDAENADLGLMTPPSSNLSSPPTPTHAGLPAIPMSPAPSASTGESSPVETMSNESTPDLASLPIEIDPKQKDQKKMLDTSYQEFLDKFCFFQSPRMTPVELEPVYSRPSFVPSKGDNSPNGFPFYGTGSNGHNSPRNTPTPTRQYNSAQDAFNFNATPRPTSAGHKQQQQKQNSDLSSPTNPLGHLAPGFHASPADTRAWAQQIHSSTASPSLTAAK